MYTYVCISIPPSGPQGGTGGLLAPAFIAQRACITLSHSTIWQYYINSPGMLRNPPDKSDVLNLHWSQLGTRRLL